MSDKVHSAQEQESDPDPGRAITYTVVLPDWRSEADPHFANHLRKIEFLCQDWLKERTAYRAEQRTDGSWTKLTTRAEKVLVGTAAEFARLGFEVQEMADGTIRLGHTLPLETEPAPPQPDEWGALDLDAELARIERLAGDWATGDFDRDSRHAQNLADQMGADLSTLATVLRRADRVIRTQGRELAELRRLLNA